MSLLRDSLSGQLIPAVALVGIAFIGFLALLTDVFLMYWTSQNLQRGSDAAALAGAAYLSDTTFTGANPQCTYAAAPELAACTYALANAVGAGEIRSIQVAADGRSIAVVVSRNLLATFARLVGFTQFTLTAEARAGIIAAGQMYNPIPIGLDSTTTYQYGQPILMHNGKCGSGCWGGVDYAGSGSSGKDFRTQLAQGCGCNVKVGSTYNSIPGAKVGNVDKGVVDRIEAGNTTDPSGTWQSHAPGNVRATTVGLVTWGNGGGSNQTATVQGLAAVWVTDSNQADFPAACQAMSNSDICAIFIRQVVPNASGTATVDAGAMRSLLLQ